MTVCEVLLLRETISWSIRIWIMTLITEDMGVAVGVYSPFTPTILTLGSSSRGIFNQATPSIWNEADQSQSLADATGGSSEASDKANRLAQMYRRPFELMHHVTLEEVVEISRHY